ncbi:MAG: flotillin family protein [Candidatus Methylacidiphilales bacterium]|nr:flotillin domain-containing protein [Candidatus Methylacidiphilales bacterium]
MENLILILTVGGTVLIGIFALVMILTRLYVQATKDRAYVRTGMGGQMVVMDGGSLVIPGLQQILAVNMLTTKLTVTRRNEQALITQDRMRVDVDAEFYVRVQPNKESIAMAASSLGSKTLNPIEVKNLMEGKFVDALRSVAAEMTLEQLHERRAEFVQKVQSAVASDLSKNGLELETVSLTSLDQTHKSFFQEQNAFDAQGLAKLTQQIEQRRKERLATEATTQVEIRRKQVDAERETLELNLQGETLRLEQERQVETLRAQQASDLKIIAAKRDQEARMAAIDAERKVTEIKISSEQMVHTQQIEADRQQKEAQLAAERQVQIATKDKEIRVAQKSQEENHAKAAAAEARATAVKAEEGVITAKAVAEAERSRQISLVQAEERAQQDAVKITVQASAERKAAENRAEAVLMEARARAASELELAKASAEGTRLQAKALREKNEAENLVSVEVMQLRVKLATIEQLPHIIAAATKPMESISNVKIVHFSGAGNPLSQNQNGGSSHGQGPVDSLSQALLSYRAQAPVIDFLLKESGVTSKGLESLISDVAVDSGKITNGLHDDHLPETKVETPKPTRLS